jgi:hypothetical protein
MERKGRKRHFVGWAVGSMPVGTNVWGKAPFTDGLSDRFGSAAMNATTRRCESFKGNFEEKSTFGCQSV